MNNLVYVFLDNDFHKKNAINPYSHSSLPDFYRATYSNNKVLTDRSYFITQKKHCFDESCIDTETLKETDEYKEIISILNTKWARYIDDSFWFNTTIRVFLLLICVIKYDLKNVLHLEADNILFEPVSKLEDIFTDGEFGYSNEAPNACAPCFMFIKNKQAAINLFNLHKKLLVKGEQVLRPHTGHFANWITDMAFLDIIYRNKKNFKMLPCVPSGSYSENFDKLQTVVDPNPYGMYFFGTNQGHAAGYCEQRHFVGEQILKKQITPTLINNKPFVIDHTLQKQIPIFNLHMHNKKIIIPFLNNVNS
jgi:hypothetical protein